jgi:hypothetical protein
MIPPAYNNGTQGESYAEDRRIGQDVLGTTPEADLTLPNGEPYTCECDLCTLLDRLDGEAQSGFKSACGDNAAIGFRRGTAQVAAVGISQETVERNAVQCRDY